MTAKIADIKKEPQSSSKTNFDEENEELKK